MTVRPYEPLTRARLGPLLAGAGTRVWEDVADTVNAKIYGRHFEELVVLAVGGAKSTRTLVGEGEPRRLEHVRSLVPADRVKTSPRLLPFSRNGFTAALQREAAGRGDVELVDLVRMYGGG